MDEIPQSGCMSVHPDGRWCGHDRCMSVFSTTPSAWWCATCGSECMRDTLTFRVYAHTDARSRGRLNFERVLVLSNPPPHLVMRDVWQSVEALRRGGDERGGRPRRRRVPRVHRRERRPHTRPGTSRGDVLTSTGTPCHG